MNLRVGCCCFLFVFFVRSDDVIYEFMSVSSCPVFNWRGFRQTWTEWAIAAWPSGETLLRRAAAHLTQSRALRRMAATNRGADGHSRKSSAFLSPHSKNTINNSHEIKHFVFCWPPVLHPTFSPHSSFLLINSPTQLSATTLRCDCAKCRPKNNAHTHTEGERQRKWAGGRRSPEPRASWAYFKHDSHSVTRTTVAEGTCSAGAQSRKMGEIVISRVHWYCESISGQQSFPWTLPDLSASTLLENSSVYAPMFTTSDT